MGDGTGTGTDAGVGAATGTTTLTGIDGDRDGEGAGDGFITLDGVEKVFQVRRRTGLLRRERREVRAVDGISFRVARGEMVGYIGPNGAGKSTTIKMLTGILTPSGGRSCGSRASTPPANVRAWHTASVWCSASGPPSGGTCRCVTRTG